VADHRRLLIEPSDDPLEVVGDLADALVGEDLRVRLRLLDGLRIIGPARRDGDEAGLLEQRGPAVPAARQEPQPVDEDDRNASGTVRLLDLRRLVVAEHCRWGRISHGRYLGAG